MDTQISKIGQKLNIFLFEAFDQMVKDFTKKFCNHGNVNYSSFLSSSLEKHAKEWKYLCYKSDQQATEYFFKKFEELKDVLKETEEDLTSLKEINSEPVVLNLNKNEPIPEVKDAVSDAYDIQENDSDDEEPNAEQNTNIIEKEVAQKDLLEKKEVQVISENQLKDAGTPVTVPDKIEIIEPEPEPSVTSDDNSEEEDEFLDEDYPDEMTSEYFSEHLKIKSKAFKLFLGPDQNGNSPINQSIPFFFLISILAQLIAPISKKSGFICGQNCGLLKYRIKSSMQGMLSTLSINCTLPFNNFYILTVSRGKHQ